MFLAESPVVSCPIYLICKNPFGIVSGSLIISTDSVLQASAFIVGIEGYIFNPCIPFSINTKIQLCPKLYGCLHFSSHDWSDPGLADTHNPVLHLVNLVVIHVLLLFIKLEDGEYCSNVLLLRCISG